MPRRIALLAAALLLCDCGGCSGCGKAPPEPPHVAPPQGEPAYPHSPASTATAPAASSPQTTAPPLGPADASTDAASDAAPIQRPSWPPQGAGCPGFAACCEAASPAGRTVCMATYNETFDCKRALDLFRSRLESLHAPIPPACRLAP